jgi:hypothetical protein
VATSSRLTLSLANQNGDGKDLADLQYFDGTTWQTTPQAMWSASTAAASCWCAWRSRPEQETAVDGPETFKLVATNTGKTAKHDDGLGTIVDDGTGDYFASRQQDRCAGGAGDGVVLDDDRVLAVSNVTVNEGSPYAVFTVTGGNKQQTDAEPGRTRTATAKTWLTCSTSTALPGRTTPQAMWSASTAAASLLVRVALSPEQETRGRRSGDLQAGGDQHRQDPQHGGSGHDRGRRHG